MKPQKKGKMAEIYRTAIIEAAAGLIAQKGVTNTSMDDIAAAAECSKPTLYAYFTDKEEIINGMIYLNMCLLKQELKATTAIEDIEQAFMAMCWAHVDLQKNVPLFFETMMGQITKIEDVNLPVVQNIYTEVKEIHKIMTDFWQRGIHLGKIRPDIDLLQTTFALWAAMCGLITMTFNRESYLDGMQVEQNSFLEYGFKTYLNSVLV